MTAAGVMALKDLVAVPGLASFLPIVLVGFVVAGLVGYFVIRWFLGFLKTRACCPSRSIAGCFR
jgi:undecaprenyl pyrophosphate phosphatase UppP